jgi:predicted O-linked N-acetylglucosamine transferase (SPINDLY family)
MPPSDDFVSRILLRINQGEAESVLPELRQALARTPGQPALLTLLAEACRLSGREAEALTFYREAGAAGGGSRNWLAAGILLAARRQTDEALACLQRALAESPADADVRDALITTCFNAGRFTEAAAAARQQLAESDRPAYLSHAALLLQSIEAYEESSQAFKSILARLGDVPALLGAALVPARFTCEWDWIEALQARISAVYAAGDYAAPQEYPLTHVTWCDDERVNLAVTRAYRTRMLPANCTPVARPTPDARTGRRLRVGYLSCDFRNHATLHLMAGLFEQHDRKRFEVFAYDYSTPEISAYRQRFLAAVEHHVDVRAMSDREAAERIAADRLDILFDLKGHTGGARPGILAHRPAALQVGYLGYPGSSGGPDLDYLVGDRWVTPETSLPGYSERFCRLPHSYQCNDRARPIAPAALDRAACGLPAGAVVFASFNQSYKIDRRSFATWLEILARVPDSVLWLLDQCPSARHALQAAAKTAGIAPERLVFAPFLPPEAHLARLQLADAVLDTLVCNGHTTTSDALWAGVPVVSALGRHFASRVSASLLHAVGLPELVGDDAAQMADIAVRLGRDAAWRQALRARLAENRLSAPLFDIARFTRNFERAIEKMVEAGPAAAARCLDVADVLEDEMSREAPAAPASSGAANSPGTPELRLPVSACPLCGVPGEDIGSADCRAHPLWHPPLPERLAWQRCPACGHVFTAHVWSPAGLAEVFRHANPGQIVDQVAQHDLRRALWAPVVERVTRLLGGYPRLFSAGGAPAWCDVGCGDGALLMTAADYGYAAEGMDARPETAARLGELGYRVPSCDFCSGHPACTPQVLSLMDVLEHLPDPRAALLHARQLLAPGGILVLSLPDAASSTWQLLERGACNPYWMEIEHYHNFSRPRLIALLRECGFTLLDFAIPQRYKAQMELYATPG